MPSETSKHGRSRFVGFGPDSIADLLNALLGTNDLYVAALDDALRVTLNQAELMTPITRFSANRLPFG